MGADWSTANIALAISGLSFLLALSSFAWNVWSKFIYPKPKVVVSARLFVSVRELGLVASIEMGRSLPSEFNGKTLEYPACGLEVTNFGPQFVIITAILGEARSKFLRRKSNSRFSAYRQYPPDPDASESEKWLKYGAVESQKIEPGGTVYLFFPVTPGLFERLSLDRICITDGFRRTHYVRKREVRRIKELVKKFVADPA